MKFSIALGVLTCALLPLFATPTVVIADPTMAASDYSGPVVFGGSGTMAGPPGNPGAFRQLMISHGPGFTVAQALGEFNVAYTYTPSAQGAMTSVSYSIDAMIESIPQNLFSAQLLFGLRQSGNSYFNQAYSPLGSSWITATRDLVPASQFTSGGPDFSSTGAKIEFGYFVDSASINGPTSYNLNVDNFCVIVDGSVRGCGEALAGATSPEPGTLALIGAGLICLGTRRFRSGATGRLFGIGNLPRHTG